MTRASTEKDPLNPLVDNPRRICLAGDLHGNGQRAREVVQHALMHGCEGIVQLGDFGIWPGHWGKVYLDQLNRDLHARGLWMLFLDGNHEDFWQLKEIPIETDTGLRRVRSHIMHIPRGTRWTWWDKTWVAMGGATSLDRTYRALGKDWWPEETITTSEALHAVADGRGDVLLMHDAPFDIPIPGLLPESVWPPGAIDKANAHRRIVQMIAEAVQPTLLFHGHFHVEYTASVSFDGTPCEVVGLAGDGQDLEANVLVMDLQQMAHPT